jgi:GDP-4-dehydro-6-deoxy-D-mannose reductase
MMRNVADAAAGEPDDCAIATRPHHSSEFVSNISYRIEQSTTVTNFSRILLTGATGFVGRHLAPALQRCYPEARLGAVVRSGARCPPGWKAIVADIVDREAVANGVASWRPDLVVHLAAQASVGQARDLAEATWRVNGVGALNLAEAVASHVPEALVFNVSSSEVYGSSFLECAASKSTPPSPRTIYARSKAFAEVAFSDVLSPKTRLITVRPFNHSGAGQDERFVLPTFAAQIARIEAGLMEPRLIVGDLSAERDFLHILDVVDAYLAILRASPGVPQRALFNVASGRPRKIADLLDLMRKAAHCSFEVVVDANRLRPSEIPRAVGDAPALPEKLNWSPRHSIDELISDLLTYWRGRIAKVVTCSYPGYLAPERPGLGVGQRTAS